MIARQVPYLDLAAQYRSLKSELDLAISRVFENSTFILGPEVEFFESEFAAYSQAQYCVGVSNGTTALSLALLAHGIGPGDEVITQANTFIATVAAIQHVGATPVLVDIKPPTYTIDVDGIDAAITVRTKAILPVHMFGQPFDINAVYALANAHGITVIEDGSQAHGALYNQKPIGSFGTTTFSFYPGKNLGAAGEAGAVVTNSHALAAKLRSLRNHGSITKYVHDELGYNARMEGIQAAILRVKLPHLDTWTSRRRAIAERYNRRLGTIERPECPPAVEPSRHIYPILVENRKAVASLLLKYGIETNVHYPIPCHLQTGFLHLGYSAGAFPHSERLAACELSLPIYPEMSDEDTDYVCDILERHS